MYKQANLSFSVTAQAYGDDVNAIQFSTQDKNSAKLVFTIKEGKAPLNLTDVDGIVDLVMGDKSVFEGNKAEVTGPLEGKLEYTITPEQIHHHGKARGELKLVSKSGQAIGGFRFTFTIKKALLDEFAGPIKEFYIEDLEAVKKEVKEKADAVVLGIDEFKVGIDSRTTAIEEQLNSLDDDVAQSTVLQVDAAKGEHANLDARIKSDVGKLTTQLAEMDGQKVDEVLRNGTILTFKANGTTLATYDLSTIANAEAVRSYVNTLVSNGTIEGARVGEKSITPENTTFLKYSKNLFNKDTISPQGQWISYTNGVKEVYPANQYIQLLHYTDFIPVKPNTKYIANLSSGVSSYVFYNSNMNFISGTTPPTNRVITTPTDCHFLIVNVRAEVLNTLQFEQGEASTPYETYQLSIPNLSLNKTVDDIKNKIVANKVKLNLPVKYDLVVGDTFELFYKGIILANNPYNYNIKIQSTKGQKFSKRYIFTPTINDIGTHVMTISIYDDNEQLLDSQNVNLVIKNKATNPSSVKNILNVGDSLTVWGQWMAELYSRLVAQNGLNKLNFIGTVGSTPKYEGYGGWTYDNYLTNVTDTSKIWAVGTHDKDQTDQWSIYKDSNNAQWKLETIESGRIKVIRTSGTTALPTSGTLTWVSGGQHTSPIVYTSTSAESGNPFWNETTNSVDFANYANELGITTIDYVNILLGWNSTHETESNYKSKIRSFINAIRKSFPEVKITLVGLQAPSLDGMGANYGTTWNYYDKLKFVFNLDKWHKDISTEFTNVDYINLSGQFDSENNIQQSERSVNIRNSKKESYGTNGVHPADEGYLQIADAVYRNMNNKI